MTSLSSVSPHEQVAEEVRALLARRRITARKAARELGWTEWYIGRRLSGKTPLDVNDLAALAGLLEVPITAFFEPRGEAYFLRNTISGPAAQSKPVFSRPVVDRDRSGLAA